MTFWNSFRTFILTLAFGSTLLALGKILVLPDPQKDDEQSFAFPAEVPLPGWKARASYALRNGTVDGIEVRPFEGRRYNYDRAGVNLAIAMTYVTNPDANAQIFRYYSARLSSSGDRGSIVAHHSRDIGFYGFSIEKGRAFLRACINPRGPSAITYEQFVYNRYTYDLQFNRIFPILLGQEPLRDQRCLWTHLSLSTQQISPELAYSILDTAWRSWFPWWRDRFP